MTGGDYLSFENKYENSIRGVFEGVMAFCMNRLPAFSGDKGEHVYERIIVIRCTNAIPKEKQDSLLVEKMYEEREAIVSMAMRAAHSVVVNGYRYDIPDSCLASREYKHFQKWAKVEMGELSVPSRAEFEQEVKSVYNIGIGEKATKHTMGGDFFPFNIDAESSTADR